jgi:hypothetical protein
LGGESIETEPEERGSHLVAVIAGIESLIDAIELNHD